MQWPGRAHAAQPQAPEAPLTAREQLFFEHFGFRLQPMVLLVRRNGPDSGQRVPACTAQRQQAQDVLRGEPLAGGLLVRGMDCIDGTPLIDIKPDRALFTPIAPPQPGDFETG